MSFLLDALCILISVGVVVMYARRSVFAAGFGVVATVLATVLAAFTVRLAAPTLASVVTAPLMEQTVANEVADMASRPHLESGRQTLEALQADGELERLMQERPALTEQAFCRYGADSQTVWNAWTQQHTAAALLTAATASAAEKVTRAALFAVAALLWVLVLRLIFQRLEQHFPPPRKYHGAKRAVPVLFGVPAGLLWVLVAVTVLYGVVPPAHRDTLVNGRVLEQTDWISLLHRFNPFEWGIGL